MWSNVNCNVIFPRHFSLFVLQSGKDTPEIIDEPIGGYEFSEFLPLPFCVRAGSYIYTLLAIISPFAVMST